MVPSRPGPVFRGLLLLLALVAVVIPVLLVRWVPTVAASPARIARRAGLPPRKVVPPTVLPDVEPVELVDLTPQDARAFNAGVPFAKGPNPAARPFHLRDTPDNLARATDCLAAALVYEAGDDPAGQRAVAQVVLNRVRHPAFPKTVCGVVFEGQDRTTGCQFTFSCDGALTRWSPSPALWTAARRIATAALTGTVYRPVGYATHYHTDWVVPYWQSSLDKIAAVHSHLFFRWAGWWGTPPAFNRQVSAEEPVIDKIAALSDAHRLGGALAAVSAATSEAATALASVDGSVPALVTDPDVGDTQAIMVALPAGLSAESYPALAAKACGTRPRCKYLGWTDAKSVPRSGDPNPTQVAAMAFSYLRDQPAGLERTLWNCTLFPHTRPGGCMRRDPGAPVSVTPPAATTPLSLSGRGPDNLGGVRRRATGSTATSTVQLPPVANEP